VCEEEDESFDGCDWHRQIGIRAKKFIVGCDNAAIIISSGRSSKTVI